jgi:hypothetical protein
MQHSEWASPTQDEVRELEYTQLQENNGNGVGTGGPGNTNNGGGTSVPINGGIWFVLLIVLIFGIWRQYPTSQRYTSES